MNEFEPGLKALSKLYERLDRVLGGPDELGPGRASTGLIDRLLHNRDIASHMATMDVQISQLAAEWRKSRGGLDPDAKKAIRGIAESLRNEAQHLRQVLERRSAQIAECRKQLEQQMAQIQKGERFLESAKPVKTNYPKFIDSVG